jgi:hypothetical protein
MPQPRWITALLLLWLMLSMTGCAQPLNSDGEDIDNAGDDAVADVTSANDEQPKEDLLPKDSVDIDNPVKDKPVQKQKPAVKPQVKSTKTPPVNDDRKKTKPDVQTIFRPSDRRPRFDDVKLAKLGIRKYESKRLKLYTDIAPERAKPLPGLIDQAYDALTDYFGELPPNRERSEFQMSGYLMADPERFRQAGLLPANLPFFYHGRHRGAEFWMNDQMDDYYRNHLMIHEATHCFMTIVPTVNAPVWYLEGMAELFGTHVVDDRGKATFRVMPHNKDSFRGLGRVTLLQTEVGVERALSISQVMNLKPNEYLKNEAYAWSWLLCKFFDTHPQYTRRFNKLGRALHSTPFSPAFREAYSRELTALMSGWPMFTHNLQDGYQNEQAGITFRPGTPLAASASRSKIEIKAAAGWQSSGVRVEKGRIYEISADGRFTLANKPKPWVSDAGGVSIRYFKSRPLGMLLATVRADVSPDGAGSKSMLKSHSIGRTARFTAPITGTLYLRLNDSWSELADNTGHVSATVRLAPAATTKK